MPISPDLRGAVLRRGRKKAGLSLQEVADRLDVNKSTVMRWEVGRVAHISLPILKSLSQLYDIPLMELYEDKNYTNASVIEIIYTPNEVQMLVSPEEQFIISLYRKLNIPEKAEILQFLKQFSKSSKKKQKKR